ncbi:hypothetical protein [Lacimonas salitolerans]|uniref:Type IV pilus biogenesis protein PilP n=1 Tax=Lacimonas salitolerans TaxID=1323750 RepID=A0ABW4ECU3_9RHOB
MKPNFALVLSFEGIRLLHRAPGGWLHAGAAALDTPDLAQAMSELRADAARLDPTGMRSKVVIPNEQIRYLSIDTAGLSDEEAAARVATALDGATPYPVSDLSYDWVRDGDHTHIAAVAYETLDEAESFAIEHEFHPVSFAAIPPDGAFSGEPFFGAAPSSGKWLNPTESLVRDMQPIRVIGTAENPTNLPSPDVDAETPAAAPEKPPEVVQTTPAAADTADETPLGEEATPVAVGALDADDVLPVPQKAADTGPEPETPADPPEPLVVATGTPDVPSFASIRAARDVPPTPKVSATAPVIDIREEAAPEAPPVTGEAPDAAAPKAAPRLTADKARQPGMQTAKAGFFSRRDSDVQTPPPARPTPSVATAPIPPAMAAAAQSVMADPVTGTEDERQRMTVFGARKPPRPPKTAVGGKPRYLGLVLTAALLLFLAGVAAWASIFSEEGGLSRLWTVSETEVATLPEEALPVDPAEIEGDETVAEDEPVDLVSVDPSFMPEDVPDEVPQVLAQPTPPLDLTPDQAAVRYAATGIWQMAPQQPDMPGFTQLDDLYTASIDPDVNMGDAVALPALRDMLGDRMMEQQSSPAAPGTDFDMDDRGMVQATPEGAVTPDGVRVFAGRPPVLPDSLPTRFEETPRLADEAQARLSAIRPRARPEDLVQQNERSNLGGLTRSELATIRPRLRPAVIEQVAQVADEVEEEAAEDAPIVAGTAQAVALSVKPRPRPGDFGQVVQRAERAPDPVQTAAVAPRTVAPNVPSSASVAREATVRNAIRLNRVNLIGVYGKPSNRSALVRMSNGRYVKVQVGDRLDGGRVNAIGESELQYTKGGRAVTLTMPRG